VAHLYFFSTHRPTQKKSKRAIKPTHQDSSKQWTKQLRKKERQHLTAPKNNWRLGASYEGFVVKETFVLRMNI
jgi:hypothetical protein